MNQTEMILEMRNISKAFPGVQALQDVSFECMRGEVHALVGENGSGKSTLVKVLNGAYAPDAGTIFLNGHEVTVRNPRYGQELGISTIYQELNLEPYLDVAENIFLGRELTNRLGLVDFRKTHAEAAELLNKVGMHLDLRKWINDLSVSQQQLVEIAKALSFRAKVVVMDEPTSALSDEETDRLFGIIRSLRGQGIAVVYITHRIKEVFEIADRVTVMKDGKVVGTEITQNLDEGSLVKMMIGRTLDTIFPKKGENGGEVVLSVRHLFRKGAFEDISFDLHKGEILGLGGLVGSGRTEVARALFGADRMDKGEVLLDGRVVKIRSPRDAVSLGFGLVPENRREEGLVTCLSVQKNTTLAVLEKIGRFIFRNPQNEREITMQLVSSLEIKCPSCDCEVALLSGGNQQKVVLSKWLAAPPRVIIFDEPTRGIDVGAKAEIHLLMRTLANKGAGILMISSELPEVLGMSDRLLVLHEGRLTGHFTAEEATEQKVMAAATGLTQ